MKYNTVDLFGPQESKGTFNDFYDREKYSSIHEAYSNNDWVKCDFVIDKNGVLYIEGYHMATPDIKKYHRINFLRPFAGIDVSDDNAGCELAQSLFKAYKPEH